MKFSPKMEAVWFYLYFEASLNFVLSPEVKWLDVHPSAEVKNEWSSTSASPCMPSWRGQVYLYLCMCSVWFSRYIPILVLFNFNPLVFVMVTLECLL